MRRNSAYLSAAAIRKLLLRILPDQGGWSEEDYLWLTDHGKRMAEFSDGFIELLPVATDRHQGIVGYMFLAFHGIVTPLGGKVHFAGMRLRLGSGKFREPDLLLLLDAKDPRRQNRFWTGADLVLEVVSKDNPERDLIQKRHEYAKAKIPEYWIVNPLTETILVFRLNGERYVRSGIYTGGSKARSRLLPNFSVDVDSVFDAD